MHSQPRLLTTSAVSLLSILLLSACGFAATPSTPTTLPPTSEIAVTPAPPDWFFVPLTDARTGQSFTIHDFAGKVVLLETMAEWCPNCNVQQAEIAKLHTLVGNTPDLVSISLDVDLHEDVASLKDYAQSFNYDWRFAVAPLAVAHDLGNLYSAEYLNPPLSPMLFIDRAGSVYTLPYHLKSAEALQKTLAPYLAPP